MICLGLILIDENEFRVPLLIVASRSTKTFPWIAFIKRYLEFQIAYAFNT